MEAKRARQRKLSDACAVQGISMKALRSVMAKLEIEGASRRQLLQAYHVRFDVVVIHEDLARKKGAPFRWEFADHAELLRVTLEESPQLQEVYRSAWRKYPCSATAPWHLIVAFDEFTPGDKLQVHNPRKTMDLVFSFAELGPQALSLTCTWLMPVAIRHAIMMELVGGWPNVFRLILRRLFMAPESFGTTGVAVRIGGVYCSIHAKLHWLLSDGEGHKITLCWKGASSMRPCLVHKNVVMKDARPMEFLGDAFVDICCHEFHRFQVRSSHEFAVSAHKVRGAHELRQARDMTKTLCEQIEMAEGLKFNPLGAIWDRDLTGRVDIHAAIIMDWVHSALQDGTMNVECLLVVDAAADADLDYSAVEEFLQRPDWEFPKKLRSRCKQLHRIFSEWRLNADEEMDKIRCSASELLSMYGLLRNFVRTRIDNDRDDLKPKLDSFFACCRVVDTFLLLKRGQIKMDAAVERLEKAMVDHMRMHKAAHGTEHIKPKHHWMFDVLERFRRDILYFMGVRKEDLMNFVVDAFFLERSHLICKDAAENVDNTRRYERSVLAGVLNKQCSALQTLVPDSVHLLDHVTAPMPGFPLARVADNMQCDGTYISVGDVVLQGDHCAGVVLACVQEGDAFFIVADVMVLVEQITPESATWQRDETQAVWAADTVAEVHGIVLDTPL